MSTELTENKAATGLTVSDDGPLSYLLDTARFNHVWRIASAIASATLLPDHLRLDRNKNPLSEKQVQSNVFRVVSQAIRWGFDPYSVVDETYVVAGRLGYQGKLIAAVVNARAGLKGNLEFLYSGSGQDRTVTVSGSFVGDTSPRTITLSVAQAKTSNKMWTSDPDQKLAYTGSTKWARRHAPEVMLGVLTDDDLDKIRETRAINVLSHPQSAEDFTGIPEEPKAPPEPPAEQTEAKQSPTGEVTYPEPFGDDLYFQDSLDQYRETEFKTIAEIITLDAATAKDKTLTDQQKWILLDGGDAKSESQLARDRTGGET